MTSELEKIDLIRARLNIGYKEAKEALEAAGGDVVQALIDLEEKGKNTGARFQAKGQEVIEQIKELVSKGQDYRIKVKQGERTVFEVPASIGALGLLGVLASSEIALLGALGTATAMAKKYTLEFERRSEPGEKTPES
ncbi:MAG: DUF4342 domain-containing protein [Desulfotomaculaceae bacterium]